MVSKSDLIWSQVVKWPVSSLPRMILHLAVFDMSGVRSTGIVFL